MISIVYLCANEISLCVALVLTARQRHTAWSSCLSSVFATKATQTLGQRRGLTIHIASPGLLAFGSGQIYAAE